MHITTEKQAAFADKIHRKDIKGRMPDKGIIFDMPNGARVYLGVYLLSDKTVSIYELYIRKTGHVKINELKRISKIALRMLRKGDIILTKSSNMLNGRASRMLSLILGFSIVSENKHGKIARLEII